MDRLNRPATIQQIRLMVALSCVIGLSLALGVTWWQVSQLTVGAQAAALRAFAVAGVAGVCVAILLVRFVRSPLWTDSPGKAHPLWWAFVFAGALVAIQVTGRVMHGALPMLFGYVAGCDLAMLVVTVTLASRGAGPRAV
jgi:hypothetical protein